MFTRKGLLTRVGNYLTPHAKEKTRISYMIQKKREKDHETLIISSDRDFTEITLLKDELNHYKVVQRLKHQYSCTETLRKDLDCIHIYPILIIQAFEIGGCDFNPYLKHEP